MFRYVAFVWNERDAAARDSARGLLEHHSRTARGWRTGLRGRGLEVRYVRAAADSSIAYELTEGGGLVLGTLFARSPEGLSRAAPQALAEADSRAMLDTNGRGAASLERARGGRTDAAAARARGDPGRQA